MRIKLSSVFVLLLLLVLLYPAVLLGHSPTMYSVAPDEAGLISAETIVTLPDKNTFDTALQDGRYLGARIKNSYAPSLMLRLDFPYRIAVSEGPFRVACSESSTGISPNYIRRAHLVPDDPKFGVQTYLNPIEAADAWDLFKGDGSVTVALIDTGIDIDHPDLQANVIGGANLRPQEDPENFDDEHGHGTAVAGIVGATTNNGEGIAGICWNVRLLILKVLGGEELTTTLFEEAAAIDYAVAHGAEVINMSFGGPGTSSVERDAILRARAAGVIMVASAGNDGQFGDHETAPGGLNYPAAYSHVIGVGAVTTQLVKADFSNYGSDQCEFVAVGTGVYTTLPSGIGEITLPILQGRKYGRANGTSFAAPQVTGLAALLMMKEPWLSYEQTKQRLRENAMGFGGPDGDGDGVDDNLGYGVIICSETLADSPVGRNDTFKMGIFPSPIFPERLFIYTQLLKGIDEGSLVIVGTPETGLPLAAEIIELEPGKYLGSLTWSPASGPLEIEVGATSGGIEYPRLIATYKP